MGRPVMLFTTPFGRGLFAALTCASILGVGHEQVLGQQPRQRTVVVSVLGRGDAPVEGLTDKDFTVREDKAAREIVRVAPAAPPANLVLLIDDSSATTSLVREIRTSLNAFADTMADQSPVPAIRLTTFGDRPTVVVDFNASFSAVSRGIDLITPRPGAGAMFLEAIIETCRDLRTRRIRGATIVAFVAEGGPEFSEVRAKAVADALRGAQASLWTITLQDTDADGMGAGPGRERATVLGDVTTESGGRNTVILTGQNLPRTFTTLATTLLARYEITYGRPEAMVPPSRLEVTGRDRSWKVQVTRWPAE